jgi:dihydrofolate synthase / folylpolyglutamate synthase
LSVRIEGIVARLHGLHPRLIDLSLDRLLVLLERLGNPQDRLPPVIHVAGTNGKGSTCAFLRSIGEQAGMRVHVYTSPHLVRFSERIRVAGTLLPDEALEAALAEVEAVNAGAPITVFEVITAVAFHLFAQVPAELCVLEVGLGGRGDATNVIARPAACAITSISLDHRDMLGETIEAIAGEKAGIIKPSVPCVTGRQGPSVLAVLEAQARANDTALATRDREWRITPHADGLRFQDAAGVLALPLPSLAGMHQVDNAGIAVAAMRAAGLGISAAAFGRGLASAEWPGRLQRLHGRLSRMLPEGWELWLDGGHNPGAGEALAGHLGQWRDRTLHLIVGMKQDKDSAGFLHPLLGHADAVWAVREPGQHLGSEPGDIVEASGGVAVAAGTVADALRGVGETPGPGRVLICGSLYLAGEVLKADG